MSEHQADTTTFVREQVETIVAGGDNVRYRVSQLVVETAEKFHLNQEGLVGLARTVMDGTATAVDRAVPHDPENVLRQVVDGLGDGLSAAALASRLAVEEAEAQRKTFAAEDLTKLNGDLRALGTMFVDTVADTARKFQSVTTAQLTALRDHAVATKQRIQPSLEAAMTAVQKHPLQFGKESVAAGFTMSRQALGALFGAVGRSLQAAGKRLAGEAK